MESLEFAVSRPIAPEGAVCLTAPTTQKARGVLALARFDTRANVPDFSIYSASIVQPRHLVGYFARPCPTRPRHGFVESRVVHNESDGRSLIQETLAADADAEIITMAPVPARFSGIWTPGALVIGSGNDGATSGSSAHTLPALGDLTAGNPRLKEEAGIEGTPYLELLWQDEDSEPQRVQLRDGPSLPHSQDYIPEAVTVTDVVLAEGDLLVWEKKMQSAPVGTAVYHPQGSLASHYAIHAVLHRVPVLISRKPAVGERLEAQAVDHETQKIDIEALQAGFYAALRWKTSQRTAAYVMLAGCHHIAVWKGRHDQLLGLALGFGYRLAVIAALGEVRHIGATGRRVDRDLVYDGSWKRTHLRRISRRFFKALKAFRERLWRSGYGGRRWFEFARWAAVLHDRLLEGNGEGALEALNQLVHSVHNGGWGFNKFVQEKVLDETAQNPVLTLVACGPTLYRASKLFERRQQNLAARFRQQREPVGYFDDLAVHEYVEFRRRRRRASW